MKHSMKRIVLVLLCVVLLVVLSSCGSSTPQMSGGQSVAQGIVAQSKILTKEQLAEFDAKGLAEAGVPMDDTGKPAIEPAATDIPVFTKQPVLDKVTPTPTVEPTEAPTETPTEEPTEVPTETPEPTAIPILTPEPMMHVIYKYSGVTETEILVTLPDDSEEYPVGTNVSPQMPDPEIIETVSGKWKFDGWTKTTDDENNLVFIGTWLLVEPAVTPEPTEELTPEVTAVPDWTVAPPTAEPVSIGTPVPDSETPTRQPESALNPMTTRGYRFQQFVLQKAGKSNAVFSGEAIMSAIALWNTLTTGAEHDVINKYVGKDYLSYQSTPTLMYLRRLWLDTLLTKGSKFPVEIEKYTEMINMQDVSATSTKNNWLNSASYGHFSYTPSTLTDKTYVDITSEVAFRDVWKSGTKPYDTKEREFHNADGTTTLTNMIRDEGLTYWKMSNAVAYCMYFHNGSYLMVILPDEGVDCSDVDVIKLMTGKIESTKAHVRFFMPGFSTESAYTLYLSDFMLSGGFVDENILSGLPGNFAPIFNQVDKVSLTNVGCGNVTSEEKMADPPTSYNDDLDVLSIVCDRPFMYYIGDATNQDIAMFGVMNKLSAEDAVLQPQQ